VKRLIVLRPIKTQGRGTLDDNKIRIFGAWRADVTGLGAREPHVEGLALPISVESGNLSFSKTGIRWMLVNLDKFRTLTGSQAAVPTLNTGMHPA
jgi:hypothetical protein